MPKCYDAKAARASGEARFGDRSGGVANCGICDAFDQASHNGEIAHAVEAGTLGRGDVTGNGAVLAGYAEGRRSDDEITAFDSTGLAIQDLAVPPTQVVNG